MFAIKLSVFSKGAARLYGEGGFDHFAAPLPENIQKLPKMYYIAPSIKIRQQGAPTRK